MHQVKIEELSNGLKITDTIDGVVVVRELSSYAFPFIRSTNEAGETYQVVDTNGEIYNLPAVPSEFLLINLNLQSYTPGTGTELIEDSYHLKPFRKDDLEDRIISIGEVTASTSIANLGLDVSGVNSVFINGNLREKYLADSFSFTPTVTGLKMLIIYAKDDAQIFYMAEGVEGSEAVEPAYTGLFVARLIVSTSGPIIDQPETDNTFKLQAEDTWRNIVINSDTAQQIVIASVPSASFNILVTDLSSAPKINGFRTKNQKNTRDGLEVKLYNDSLKPIEFIASSTSTVGDITTYGIKAGFILAPAAFAKMVRKNDLYEILPAGEVFDPSVLQAQIDTLDADLDAEVVNRAMADALKLDKPLSPNNTSERLIEADGGTTAKSNYQRNKQFFVSLPATVLEDWKGCIVFFTSSGNLTVPIGLTADFTFNGVVDNGVTLTPAITGPMAWLGTAPAAFSGVAIFTMVRRDGTNNFQILGV